MAFGDGHGVGNPGEGAQGGNPGDSSEVFVGNEHLQRAMPVIRGPRACQVRRELIRGSLTPYILHPGDARAPHIRRELIRGSLIPSHSNRFNSLPIAALRAALGSSFVSTHTAGLLMELEVAVKCSQVGFQNCACHSQFQHSQGGSLCCSSEAHAGSQTPKISWMAIGGYGSPLTNAPSKTLDAPGAPNRQFASGSSSNGSMLLRIVVTYFKMHKTAKPAGGGHGYLGPPR